MRSTRQFVQFVWMYLRPVDRTELARRIYDAAHLTGTFTLALRSREQRVLRQVPIRVRPTAALPTSPTRARTLVPAGIDALAGLELGGVPLATMISQVTGLPAVFVRKEAKTYGTCQLAEGAEIEGRRLCIVEDVVTSGGAILDAAVGAARRRRRARPGHLRHRSRVGRTREAGSRRSRALGALHDERAQRGCSGSVDLAPRENGARLARTPSSLGAECDPAGSRRTFAIKPSVTHRACAGVVPACTSCDSSRLGL